MQFIGYWITGFCFPRIIYYWLVQSIDCQYACILSCPNASNANSRIAKVRIKFLFMKRWTKNFSTLVTCVLFNSFIFALEIVVKKFSRITPLYISQIISRKRLEKIIKIEWAFYYKMLSGIFLNQQKWK